MDTITSIELIRRRYSDWVMLSRNGGSGFQWAYVVPFAFHLQ